MHRFLQTYILCVCVRVRTNGYTTTIYIYMCVCTSTCFLNAKDINFTIFQPSFNPYKSYNSEYHGTLRNTEAAGPHDLDQSPAPWNDAPERAAKWRSGPAPPRPQRCAPHRPNKAPVITGGRPPPHGTSKIWWVIIIHHNSRYSMKNC